MSIQEPRALRRSGANYFGPNHDAVATLVGRVATASPEQLSAAIGIASGTGYLVALGAAWRAARKSGLTKQVERSSEAAFAAMRALADPTAERRAADVMANVAIATALEGKLEARYAELLLAPGTALSD